MLGFPSIESRIERNAQMRINSNLLFLDFLKVWPNNDFTALWKSVKSDRIIRIQRISSKIDDGWRFTSDDVIKKLLLNFIRHQSLIEMGKHIGWKLAIRASG